MAGLLATISFASCGGDPAGNDPPAPPTETEKYAAWIDRWSDDADAWSRAYFRVVDEVSDENDGSLSIDKVHRAGVTLADAAVALQAGLDQAGRLESKAAAPTYPQALASVSERVLADANAVASCAGPACSARFTSLFTSAPVLERLVVRTSGKLREASPATREVPLADGILGAGDVGGIALGDRVDPSDFVCEPAFEDGDALEASRSPRPPRRAASRRRAGSRPSTRSSSGAGRSTRRATSRRSMSGRSHAPSSASRTGSPGATSSGPTSRSGPWRGAASPRRIADA